MATPPSDREPSPAVPPEAWAPLLRLARRTTQPLERFLQIEAASGILLLCAALLALLWANSPWASLYAQLFQTPLGIRVGSFQFERPLDWAINDALMVLFFFVVGMEIRRELHDGELSEWRRAVLPLGAALGGMVVPALLYVLSAGAPSTRSGWGVPMATDIAFAVGVLTLLGKRVPAALRVLLLALAVIDDLGAILVIAVFYSTGIVLKGLLLAVAGIVAIVAMQRMGIRNKALYVPPALLTWAGIYAAGVHPTIAGVLVGLLTPVRAWLGPSGFIHGVQEHLQELLAAPTHSLPPEQIRSRLREINRARREALSPAEALIEALHPWVAYGIMPLFALANAGVRLDSLSLDGSALRVFSGAGLGLLLGKPVGVFCASLLATKLGIAALPGGLTNRHLVVLGVVAGIGFTMSLFIAQLAFADPGLLAAAKLGVLSASLTAGLASIVLGRILLPERTAVPCAQSADEAETSTEL